MIASIFVAVVMLGGVPDEAACSVREGDARYWIDNAAVIVRAKVLDQRERRLTVVEARAQSLKGSSPTRIGTLVRFEVVETLKGTAPRFLEFDGEITDSKEFDENEPELPRRWVRRGGRGGDCFALQYRAGEEYLLMLQESNGVLSPYWAAMGATNEHVEGPGDPWLRWVRDYLSRKR